MISGKAVCRRRRFSVEEEERILAEARQLYGTGISWTQLTRQLGVGEDWLRRRLLYGYSTKMNQRFRAAQHNQKRPTLNIAPPDTRDFTARFCGDPLPGRSALDRRGHDA